MHLPEGTVLVPLLRYDLPREEALRALQFIRPDGAKIYQRGMDKPGCSLRLGSIDTNTTPLLLVVEGYATGLTARQAVDQKYPVFVALDAGNLAHVVPLLRKLYPFTRILILADDDWMTRDKVSGGVDQPWPQRRKGRRPQGGRGGFGVANIQACHSAGEGYRTSTTCRRVRALMRCAPVWRGRKMMARRYG